MIDWSPQQDAAIKAATEWLGSTGQQVHRLFGYAGTGKTTLAKEIAANVKGGDVMYGAFTGKAASVMRKKGCDGASTIHSMIYRPKKNKKNREEPKFVLNHDSAVRDAKLVVIDECSMVDEKIGADLLSFGTKVLVLGDPAQLPPVKGAGFFTEQEPDTMMTEVHRQARDNPIIALSMLIRTGQKLQHGTFGGSRIITREELEQDDVLGADQVIVGMNKTRHAYNARIRALIGRESKLPVPRDKLVCLKNDGTVGIFNGGMWTVEKAAPAEDKIIELDILSDDDTPVGKTVFVREEFFIGGESDIPWQEKRGTQEFTYGYALTCHKAQGSQWQNITVFDESSAFRDDAKRWAYTAVTRAAEKLTLVM